MPYTQVVGPDYYYTRLTQQHQLVSRTSTLAPRPPPLTLTLTFTLHTKVGNDYDSDVKGATAAGWNALYVKAPAYTNLPAQTAETPFTVVGDVGKVLDVFGLEDPEQVIVTTSHRTDNTHANW